MATIRLPSLKTFNASNLRDNFPLPSSLDDVNLSVENPGPFLDRVCALRSCGQLPLLVALTLNEVKGGDWVPPQNAMAVTCLQGLKMLRIMSYKARPSMHVII